MCFRSDLNLVSNLKFYLSAIQRNKKNRFYKVIQRLDYYSVDFKNFQIIMQIKGLERSWEAELKCEGPTTIYLSFRKYRRSIGESTM